MNKDHRAIKYNNYIKRIIILLCLPLFVVLIALLTKESNEPLDWGLIILTFVVCVFLILVLVFARRATMNSLIMLDIDWHTFYELDKRSPKSELYNLKILINVYSYDGDYVNVLNCADRILELSSKPLDVYIATHHKISALFLMGNAEETIRLINQQRHLASNNKIPDSYNRELIYAFMENYLNNDYNKALEALNSIPVNDKVVLNQRTVITNYYMRMVYLKLNDEQQVDICTNAILSADRERNTFYAKEVAGQSK